MRGIPLCLTFILCCAASVFAAPAEPLIPALDQLKRDRPRLLLRPKATPFAISLEQLKSIPRDADFKTIQDRLAKQTRSAAAQALVYHLSGDTAAADRGVALLRAWKPATTDDPFSVYAFLDHAFAYDWLYTYPSFTAEMKAEVRKNAKPLAESGLKISNDHIFHNYVWMSAGGTMLWALATAGDDADADALYAEMRGRFNDRLFPAMRYLDGAPSEPMGYWSLYCLSPGVWSLLAAQSASEQDLVGRIAKEQGNWLQRHLDGVVAGTLPNLRFVPWGDLVNGPDGAVTHEMAGSIDAMTWALKSRSGAFLSAAVAKKRGLDRFYGTHAIFYPIYARNLGVQPDTPPLGVLLGGKEGGHALMRSDWTDSATIVGFRCTDHFGNHNHFDQGSFVIYRNGALAVDAGKYRHPGEAQQKTENHNTLIINRQPQRKVQGQWFKTLAEFQRNLTGGKRLETGSIVSFKDDGVTATVVGEFAQAYPAGLVKSCERHILFVRPATVAVVDFIVPDKTDTPLKVDWLLHLPGTATVEKDVAGASNGASWIRCRPLQPTAVPPAVAPSLPTYGLAKEAASHVTYSYEGQGARTLVHVIDVGDGAAPAELPAVTVKANDAGVDVTIAGRTYAFLRGAPSPIRATLAPKPGDRDMHVLHITNVSQRTVRFLDINEGSGECGNFYEVTVTKDGRRIGSGGWCLYAPVGRPHTVVLAPGQTYDRDIQLGAYMRNEQHVAAPYEITVTYRLTGYHRGLSASTKSSDDRPDLDLTFETEPLRIGG